MIEIRTLRADEIECRVQQVKQNGCVLLLYKDARCDMRILDEVFGVLGWEREHQVIDGNLYCTVRVWDEEHNRWVSKQDVGTESMTEKQKGQASDSFKRACFNLGIGRELYSAPFIWITLNPDEIKQDGNKFRLNFGVEFHVKEIGYSENREINKLVIVDKKGNIRFSLGINSNNDLNIENRWTNSTNQGTINKKLTDKQISRLYAIAYSKGIDKDTVKKHVFKKFTKDVVDMTKDEYDLVCSGYENLQNKSNEVV